MPRKYHSPSSIDLGRRCRRAYWYRYVEGLRKPEPVWSESLKGRDRSLALGKALHATLEAHFTPGGQPNWIWFPGEVAASGVTLLPDRERLPIVEQGIGARGTGADIGPGHDGRTRFTVTIAGVPWLGYKDLTDLKAPALYDYKSTKSIDRYAKSVAELLQDLQANLYAYDTMTELRADELFCRWVYFETDRKRRAEPRDFIVKRAEALSVIECAAEVAKELDLIDTIDQAPMNVSACAEYGGCEFHEKVGGPCSAHVPVGALIQARVPKKGNQTMPLNPASRANLGARFPQAGAVPVAASSVIAEFAEAMPSVIAESTPSVIAPVQPAPAPAPVNETPARRGRPARSSVGASGSLAELASALTAAEAAHVEAASALETAKENMRKALA
jgi:hypothetical protein